MEHGCSACFMNHVLFVIEDDERRQSEREYFAWGFGVVKCERDMTSGCSDAEHDGDTLFGSSSGFLKRACHMWDGWPNGYE